jgi:hypothetical protein
LAAPSPPGLGRAGRFHRVEGIGLAVAATGLPVRTVDLDHLNTGAAQQTGQPGTIRAGALDPDPGHRAEGLQPAQQLVIAGAGGLKALHPQQPADLIERGGHVHVQMGVDPTGDGALISYD